MASAALRAAVWAWLARSIAVAVRALSAFWRASALWASGGMVVTGAPLLGFAAPTDGDAVQRIPETVCASTGWVANRVSRLAPERRRRRERAD